MNDPNGPIFWRGQYHMFFQYNPNAAVWGDMHWAHAVSPDMIHWKHLPIALAPTPDSFDGDGCFSGSAVVFNGTPTFLFTGVKTVPPAQATLRDGTHNFLETQCLATSNDPELRTWNKLPNPVLFPPKDPKLTGFRDPFLWHDSNRWYLGVGSGQRGEGGRVLLYRSNDLRKWEYLHPFASGDRNGKEASDPVDTAEMWECPDFFPLGSKFALLYSTERKVYWQTGELDSQAMRFHPAKSGLLDVGAFYAPKSQLDAHGRRILWGWIPETRPEAEFSAAGWAGCMSLPRVLSLGADDGLVMRVIGELAQLRFPEISVPGPETSSSVFLDALGKIELKDAAAEFQLRFQSRAFRLELCNGTSPIVSFSFDPSRTNRELQIAAPSAGVPAVVEAGVPPTPSGEHQLRFFLDASVLECFVDDGVALTARVYSPGNRGIRVSVPSPGPDAVISLSIWPLRPISSDRLTS